MRLQAIDAPEKAQGRWRAPMRHLASRVFSQQVVVEYHTKDRYGRIVGLVRLDGVDINHDQIAGEAHGSVGSTPGSYREKCKRTMLWPKTLPRRAKLVCSNPHLPRVVGSGGIEILSARTKQGESWQWELCS